MEVIQGTHKASKFDREDFISIMPDIVVTNIVDRLPLQDAVRTSILSRKWRFKWTMLSQLIFDDNFFKYLLQRKGESNYGRIISRLLLHLKGTITKFVLYIEDQSYSVLSDEDIHHWILFLSTKGIKDLTFCKKHGQPLKLPTHLFSCLELKRLKLYNCCFDPPARFHGFPNLLRLECYLVQFKSDKFGEFITRCPLLEVLNLRLRGILPHRISMEIYSVGKMKLVEIEKLAKLKRLTLSLCFFDDMVTNSSSIFELVGSLPKLQKLELDFVMCKLTDGGAKKGSLASFPCLKDLKLTRIDLGDGIVSSCAFELIRCSPNLQTLEIRETFTYDTDPSPMILEEENNTMRPLQLRNVVFQELKGSENEVCLIKYLLACSPFLKQIAIHPCPSLESSEKLFVRKLLKLRRASPIAEIKLY